MNSWKFNSTANYVLRAAIYNSLNISPLDVYKTLKSIGTYSPDIIETKDGKKYKLVLEEI